MQFDKWLTHHPIFLTLLHRYPHDTFLRADIAQLVEQRIRNAKVVGSTPIIGTIFSNKII